MMKQSSAFRSLVCLAAFLVFWIGPVLSSSSTWTGTSSSDALNADNWDPNDLPSESSTLLFGATQNPIVNISFNEHLVLGGAVFELGAPTYTFSANMLTNQALDVTAGFINNSGVQQNLSVNSGRLVLGSSNPRSEGNVSSGIIISNTADGKESSVEIYGGSFQGTLRNYAFGSAEGYGYGGSSTYASAYFLEGAQVVSGGAIYNAGGRTTFDDSNEQGTKLNGGIITNTVDANQNMGKTFFQNGALASSGTINNRGGQTSFSRSSATGISLYNLRDTSGNSTNFGITTFNISQWSGGLMAFEVTAAGEAGQAVLGGGSTATLTDTALQIIMNPGDYATQAYLLIDVNPENSFLIGEFSSINLVDSSLNPIIGVTFQTSYDSSGFQITLTGTPTSSSGRNVHTSVANVMAQNSFSTSTILSGVMEAASAEGDTGAAISAGADFATNPLTAPNLTSDFLHATNQGIAHATQDNMRRWAPARTEKTGIWIQPFGMVLRQVTDGATPGYKVRTGGLLGGFDHKFRYDIVAGAALGYARTTMNFDENSGKTNVKDKFLSIFGTWFRDKWYVEGSLIMGLEKYQGTRNTNFNNIFVSNNHNGYKITPHLGGGYTFDVKDAKLKAFGKLDYAHSTQYGYQEKGAGGFYLKQASASMLRSEIGAKLSKIYDYNGFSWKPAFALSAVNKKPIKKGTIAASNGSSFESTTKTTTNISPALESIIKFSDGYSFSATWLGEFGSQYNMQEAFIKITKKL